MVIGSFRVAEGRGAGHGCLAFARLGAGRELGQHPFFFGILARVSS